MSGLLSCPWLCELPTGSQAAVGLLSRPTFPAEPARKGWPVDLLLKGCLSSSHRVAEPPGCQRSSWSEGRLGAGVALGARAVWLPTQLLERGPSGRRRSSWSEGRLGADAALGARAVWARALLCRRAVWAPAQLLDRGLSGRRRSCWTEGCPGAGVAVGPRAVRASACSSEGGAACCSSEGGAACRSSEGGAGAAVQARVAPPAGGAGAAVQARAAPPAGLLFLLLQRRSAFHGADPHSMAQGCCRAARKLLSSAQSSGGGACGFDGRWDDKDSAAAGTAGMASTAAAWLLQRQRRRCHGRCHDDGSGGPAAAVTKTAAAWPLRRHGSRHTEQTTSTFRVCPLGARLRHRRGSPSITE
eukprot:364567-Chlamydomonas_euryale.AAC.9